MEFLKFARVQWDRTTAIVAAIAGVVCLLIGFHGVSNTPYVGAQLPYFISGGLFGMYFLGVAAVSWLTADLRDEWRELRAIRVLLDEDVRLRTAALVELERGSRDAGGYAEGAKRPATRRRTAGADRTSKSSPSS